MFLLEYDHLFLIIQGVTTIKHILYKKEYLLMQIKYDPLNISMMKVF
jgi:hypothetical protein